MMKLPLSTRIMEPGRKGVYFIALGLVVCLVLSVMAGCAKKRIPHSLVPEYENRTIRLIAVLPSQDKTANPELNVLLRKKLTDALYYKGYPRIPLNVIDEKLTVFFKGTKTPDIKALPPRDVGGVLGVDAVLYATLENCRTSFFWLYASSSAKVKFSLYYAKTGELLWQTEYKISETNFDITPSRLKLKASQFYEPALNEIIGKAMETLPDGPDV